MQSVERAGGADEALQLDDAIGVLYTRCLADTQRHVPFFSAASRSGLV
jgi:hypothetical protein